jgi:hypothetical protein
MDLVDADLVKALAARDGPMPARSSRHLASGECRYEQVYKGQGCPWCLADARRRLAAAVPSE